MYNGWGSQWYSSRVWPATLEPTSKRPMTSDPSWRAWREASTHSLSTLWISARGFAKISHALLFSYYNAHCRGFGRLLTHACLILALRARMKQQRVDTGIAYAQTRTNTHKLKPSTPTGTYSSAASATVTRRRETGHS